MLLVFLIITTTILQISALEKRKCVFVWRYEVHIINNLPRRSAPLKLHCASRDDDLGYHTLPINQDFHWQFCANIFNTTLFFCHFWWGSKEKVFNVFDSDRRGKCDVTCNWIAKSDGIYFSGFNFNTTKSLSKEFNWDVSK
ncbi:hypothetical protein Pfo_015416 [Paulownia fortunei]|nr:hypothetical protein Pfo_015416 [Paulownia fortunei]